MTGSRNSERGVSAAIAMIVTGAHIAIASLFLTHEFQSDVSFEPDVLDIALAELAPLETGNPDPVSPQPEPAPIVTPQTDQAPPQVADPPPLPDPAPPAPEQNAQNDTPAPRVPPQSATADAGAVTAPAPTSSVGASDPCTADAVSPAQVAVVLEKMHCLKLKRHEEGACPPPDPFDVAIAAAERDIPPESLFGDPRYVSQTVNDKLFEQRAKNRFHWPDADLFAGPLPPGTYNARRIRNGQEPLWSQEMRDGFRKSDE